MKKRMFLLALAALLTLAGCAEETKTVICDGCGKELTIDADSNMDDSWIIYCHDCEIEFFGEDGLVSEG